MTQFLNDYAVAVFEAADETADDTNQAKRHRIKIFIGLRIA